jgi:transposase InsO family protein
VTDPLTREDLRALWSLPLHNLEVFMAHRNARLTPHGRRLLVRRVRDEGMPVAHAAKAMGVSRKCGHYWLARYDAEGDAGLYDRSSRPHTMPTRTSDEVEQQVLAARVEHRRGQDWLGPELGVAPRTVSRILRRHDMPRLCTLDPMTGEVIRSSKETAIRYERDRPGELVHMDVKKIGRVPDGGGWRAHGRPATSTTRDRKAGVGYDYVHSVVDDNSRLAYCEIHDDERADTVCEFFERAIDHFARHGITIERLMTDNAFAYRNSRRLRALLADHRIKHKFIRPHCPWQNGKVERFNRTLQTEWAYRRVFTTNAERRAALPDFIHYYNHQRRHSAIGGLPPASRLSPT